MKKRASLLFSLTLVLAALILINSVISAGATEKAAPAFTLKDLDGKDVSLSDFEGKVIFVNFWATWCPPCRQEIPGFIEVYDQYKNKGMVILGVSVDQAGVSVVKKFAEKNKINYPLVMFTQKMIEDYDPGNAIPATIVIDRQGNIRDKHIKL